MLVIESLVQDSQKLTALFGSWPSFHDAEVVDLHLWRGDVKPGDWDDRNVFPIVTVKLRVLGATQPGATDSGRDVFVTLRFHDVDDFKMDRFDHINMIFELSISTQERGTFTSGERLPPYLIVSFEPSAGIRMSFRCFRIAVVDAVYCED
jgi:Immunity protein 50